MFTVPVALTVTVKSRLVPVTLEAGTFTLNFSPLLNFVLLLPEASTTIVPVGAFLSDTL